MLIFQYKNKTIRSKDIEGFHVDLNKDDNLLRIDITDKKGKTNLLRIDIAKALKESNLYNIPEEHLKEIVWQIKNRLVHLFTFRLCLFHNSYGTLSKNDKTFLVDFEELIKQSADIFAYEYIKKAEVNKWE